MTDDNTAPPARFIIVPHFMWIELHSNELLLYLALAAHADQRGYSWPSHATLAAETGLSVSTVKRTLKGMMGRKGFRQVKRSAKDGGQTSNGYFIPLHHP